MSNRLSREARLKDLRLAISRIERGRARIAQGTDLSVAAVAAEAKVSTALIHNQYPEIAEYIREKQGRSSRAQRDAKHAELKDALARNKALREEVKELRAEMAKLASINATLMAKTLQLEAISMAKNVSVLPSRDPKNS